MAEGAKEQAKGAAKESGGKSAAKPPEKTRSTKAKSATAKSAKSAESKTASTKSAKAKEEESREAKLPKLKDVGHWIGLRIDGIGNRTLGRVAALHVDAEDGEPRWVVLRLGPIAGCTAIPFEHVAEGAGRLWAAYERAWVREAPRFRPNEALTPDNELELCAHWGFREKRGRSAELAKIDGDEISSIPAEL